MQHWPLAQLTLARFREFFREPAALFWVYGFPLLLAIALGMAFRERPVEKIDIDIAQDHHEAAEKLASMLESEQITLHKHSEEESRRRLRTAKTALVIIPGASLDTREYLLDPTRPECLLAKSAAERQILQKQNTQYRSPKEYELDEPGGRYIDFLIPGLIGINLMGGGLFGVGFVVVDMRVRQLLKRFLATPMKKTDFLLSLMISRFVFTIIEVTMLIVVAHFIFDIRIYGNFLALMILVFAGGACFAGLGLLIACRAKTLETVSGLMNAIMLPMYVVSGVFFSSERFPDVVQPIIKVLPLTVLNNGLRAIMNDGEGWAALPYPLLILALWGGLAFVIALRFFRWR